MTVKPVGSGKVGESRHDRFSDKKRQNGRQNVIFDIMSEVQKDSQEVSAGIGQFYKYKT
jgi:hypothetical protein